MSRAEFVSFLIAHLLKEGQGKETADGYVTHHELEEFEKDMRSLLRSFLDFFLTYGLELGPSPKGDDIHAEVLKLKEVVGSPESGEASAQG